MLDQIFDLDFRTSSME